MSMIAAPPTLVSVYGRMIGELALVQTHVSKAEFCISVEIIANDQGNRTTPSYVAFTDSERLIGDAAKNQTAMNPHNTVSSETALRFCGS